jgi:hypothetical protein
MARKKPTAAQIEALDGLARHAIAEHDAGRTKPLRQFAAEQGIPLDPPPHRVKSFSLTEEDIAFVASVAWSRRESESAVVRWALMLLRELLDGE